MLSCTNLLCLPFLAQGTSDVPLKYPALPSHPPAGTSVLKHTLFGSQCHLLLSSSSPISLCPAPQLTGLGPFSPLSLATEIPLETTGSGTKEKFSPAYITKWIKVISYS